MHFLHWKVPSRPGKNLGRVRLTAFEDKNMCVVSCIKEYICRTKPLRASNAQLLLSYCKPFKHVSSETISLWLKKVLESAGIDTTVYGAHVARSASTSAAKTANVPVEVIMNAAGWTNAGKFRKFYNKLVETPNNFSCFWQVALNKMFINLLIYLICIRQYR